MDLLTIEQCLARLRAVDDIVMAHDELAVAVHLSRAIEELAARAGQAEGGPAGPDRTA